MSDPVTVYLIVHELFGIIFDGEQIELVTPVVEAHSECGGHKPLDGQMPHHGHKYRIGRFKAGKFQSEVPMEYGETYRLCGVVPRQSMATNFPCHAEFSSHPPGKLQLNHEEKPFCRWKLPLPKHIHQLRVVSIPDSSRPVFTGDPHGDAVNAQLAAVSLTQAFEYELASQDKFGIFNDEGLVAGLDYTPDTDDKEHPTINLHLWAQLEDEAGMSSGGASVHASIATCKLVKLFKGLVMEGSTSLPINSCHTTQVHMPDGIRFPELMTLAEKFVLLGKRGEAPSEARPHAECTGKTCGHGGNLFITS